MITIQQRAQMTAIANRARLLLPEERIDVEEFVSKLAAIHLGQRRVNLNKFLKLKHFNFVHDVGAVIVGDIPMISREWEK